MSRHDEQNYSGNKNSSTKLPRIDSVQPVASTKWLALETYHWTDQDGKSRQWDVATRTTKPSLDDMLLMGGQSHNKNDSAPGNTRSAADAVVIIPILKSTTRSTTAATTTSTAELETLLVEQFRPPVRQTTMEFPAGLVDPGETVEQAALRELKEETGYVGKLFGRPDDDDDMASCPTGGVVVSRSLCMTPGLATETVHIVLVQVDLDHPNNRNQGGATPKQKLDDGEHVKVHRVHLDEGIKTLLDHCPAMPLMGLYLFAVGYQLGAAHNHPDPNKKKEHPMQEMEK